MMILHPTQSTRFCVCADRELKNKKVFKQLIYILLFFITMKMRNVFSYLLHPPTPTPPPQPCYHKHSFVVYFIWVNSVTYKVINKSVHIVICFACLCHGVCCGWPAHLPGQLQIAVPCCVMHLFALPTAHTCHVVLCTSSTLTWSTADTCVMLCCVPVCLDTCLVHSAYLCHGVYLSNLDTCQVIIPVPCNDVVYLSTLILAWSTVHTCAM